MSVWAGLWLGEPVIIPGTQTGKLFLHLSIIQTNLLTISVSSHLSWYVQLWFYKKKSLQNSLFKFSLEFMYVVSKTILMQQILTKNCYWLQNKEFSDEIFKSLIIYQNLNRSENSIGCLIQKRKFQLVTVTVFWRIQTGSNPWNREVWQWNNRT